MGSDNKRDKVAASGGKAAEAAAAARAASSSRTGYAQAGTSAAPPPPTLAPAPHAPIQLIAADGESFTIEPYHLLAASAAFRARAATHDLSSTPPIHFFDAATESGGTLRLFLSLITTGSVSLPPVVVLAPDTHLAELDALVRFLRRWGCGPALSTLTLALGAEVRLRRLPPLAAFVLASTADDLELALAALKARREADVRWAKAKAKGKACNTAPKPNARGLDPKGWPLDVWSRVAPTYAWALVRAAGEADWDDKSFDRAFEGFVRAAKDGEVVA